MAGLTVLDASILIAILDAGDPHADVAATIVEEADSLAIGALTLAEALVKPVQDGTADVVLNLLNELDVMRVEMAAESEVRLARLRAETRLKMPDCYVLHTAIELGAEALATRDGGLRAHAERRGLRTP